MTVRQGNRLSIIQYSTSSMSALILLVGVMDHPHQPLDMLLGCCKPLLVRRGFGYRHLDCIAHLELRLARQPLALDQRCYGFKGFLKRAPHQSV